ncbi:hypothetical protein GF318_06135 [Candidatus Micrarchaeota archaeon]|nr:hypothetical protein [Candidatus Micrarchaeota archaeon]
MIMDDLDFALKYPFSSEAKQIVQNIHLTDRVLELGAERIKKALRGESKARVVLNQEGKKEDIASFAAARMILGFMKNTFLTNKFAVNESKVVRSHLDKEDKKTVERVAARFDIFPENRNNTMLLDLPTYVRFSVRSPYYRLVNRKLTNGFVEINDNDLRRLVEEAVRKHTEDIPVVRDPPKQVKHIAERIIEELPKSETTINAKEGDHPPCILNLLESAKKHQNLNHSARWYLATYLNAIGMGEDAITGIYAQLPDFNEKTTRYQIKHLRRKGYNVPSCSTVMSYGLCVASCRTGNPVRWHKLSESRKKEILK